METTDSRDILGNLLDICMCDLDEAVRLFVCDLYDSPMREGGLCVFREYYARRGEQLNLSCLSTLAMVFDGEIKFFEEYAKVCQQIDRMLSRTQAFGNRYVLPTNQRIVRPPERANRGRRTPYITPKK